MTPSASAARPGYRPAWAEVDLDAVRHNVRSLASVAAPARLLAVVKADAYGHGAVRVAQAALDAGAEWLGVALAEEGIELREAGIDARVLILSQPPAAAAAAIVEHGFTPVMYTNDGVDALAKAVADAGAEPLRVHVKVDTGMHRVGCSPEETAALIAHIDARPEIDVEGVCTHLAVADVPDDPYNAEQLDRFDDVLAALGDRANELIVHAANSAGAIAHPRARHDLVRCGIAMYGIPPSPDLAGSADLQPVLSIKAQVSHAKPLASAESVSYGRHYRAPGDTHVVTVPIGYADGVPRNLGLTGGEVLIRGRRFPIAGSVTMDQLVVDLGPDGPMLDPDEPVTLLGRDGDEEVTATEWAERLGVIPYEVTTRIGPRLPKVYVP
ncbi:MAG: alanine racemase [Actinobacteria bacterium]|nr:alanine racemase [Actinomycetota bacterium]